MTCASEGAVDVYVEPFVQARALIVVGATPVADALARLARSMDYDVVRVVDARERRDIEPEAAALGITVVPLDDARARVARERCRATAAAVVASQGHYDEEALESILKAGVPYVGLVASRKRGATVRACSRTAACRASRRCGIRRASTSARGPRRRSRCRSSRKSSRTQPSERLKRRAGAGTGRGADDGAPSIRCAA